MQPADIAAARRLRSIWDKRRTELELTQEKAADLLGWTQGAVSHYLNGKIPLGLPAVFKWAALLRTSPYAIRPEIAEVIGPAADSGMVREEHGGYETATPGKELLDRLGRLIAEGSLSDRDIDVLRAITERLATASSGSGKN